MSTTEHRDPMTPPASVSDRPPALRVLSLGAGVQSSALLILAAQGKLPKPDAAVFADTGWEPKAVYEHLDRLEREVAGPAGIPIHRVANGNIRTDAFDAEHRFASMPLYIRNPDDTEGILRRQCTKEYKLVPIRRAVRQLLGYPHPNRVPKGVWAEQWIGISTDERDRAERRPDDVAFTRNRFPLLEMDLSRDHCREILTRAGFGQTPKSACIGCPFHANVQWRQLRNEAPEEFADAVAFDAAIRKGMARHHVLGQAYLHRARIPLDQAPIDRVTFREWADRQGDLLHEIEINDFEESLEDPNSIGGCSPFGCHSDGVEDEDPEAIDLAALEAAADGPDAQELEE